MKLKYFISFISFVTIFTFSCTNDIMYTENDQVEHVSDSNFVSINEALIIASKQKMLTTRGLSDLNNFYEMKQNTEIPQFYIINFKEGGFIIISADKRIEPILAYSESSYFPLDDFSDMPYGLSFWLNSTCNFIDSVRYENKEQDMRKITSWRKASNPSVNYIPENVKDTRSTKGGRRVGEYIYLTGDPNWDHDDCNMEGELLASYYYYVEPLLKTHWDQGDGYNNVLPTIDCYPTPKTPDVGCVAVAVGQVMLHNKYPTSFGWSHIGPPNVSTQYFLKEIGKPGNLNIQYGCNGSSAQILDAVEYLTKIGYSVRQDYTSFNSSAIESDVGYNYPAILAGQEGSDGHMWVCDGINIL